MPSTRVQTEFSKPFPNFLGRARTLDYDRPRSSPTTLQSERALRRIFKAYASRNSPSIKIYAIENGGGEIRTLDALRHAAFPRRWNKPLSDASNRSRYTRKKPSRTGTRAPAWVRDGVSLRCEYGPGAR